MLLAPDEDELQIADAAEAYLRDVLPIARLHRQGGADLDPDTRSGLAAMGWFALAVPEAEGGSGLSAVEHVLFFREVGRQCGPLDILAQSLGALVAAGTPFGERLIAGEDGVALAVRDATGMRLLGAPHAAFALEAGPLGARLLSLEGISADTRSPLDPANSLRVMQEAEPTIVAKADGAEIWRLGQLGAAAMLLGMAENALDLVVDYARIRETFGRKIGSYQAVRHPAADMAVRTEAARSQLYFAATATREQHPAAPAHVDAAKHLANEAALKNTDLNIQLHGGIGVTDEHDAHLLLKHTLVLSRIFGDRRALLHALLDAGLEN